VLLLGTPVLSGAETPVLRGKMYEFTGKPPEIDTAVARMELDVEFAG
jgi:hypothetical protein